MNNIDRIREEAEEVRRGGRLTVEERRKQCEDKGRELRNNFNLVFRYEPERIEEWSKKKWVKYLMKEEGIATSVELGTISIQIKPKHRIYQCDKTGELFLERNGKFKLTDGYREL